MFGLRVQLIDCRSHIESRAAFRHGFLNVRQFVQIEEVQPAGHVIEHLAHKRMRIEKVLIELEVVPEEAERHHVPVAMPEHARGEVKASRLHAEGHHLRIAWAEFDS